MVAATANPKLFPVHLDLQVLPDLLVLREMLELLVTLVVQDLKDRPVNLVNQAHPAIPEKRELLATTALLANPALLVILEKRAHLATMAPPAWLELLEPQEKMATLVDLAQLDLKVTLVRLATLSHPRSLVLLVHLDYPAKTELQDTLAAQDPLDPSDPSDLLDSQVNQAHLDTPAGLDLKDQLDPTATPELPAKTVSLAHRAKSLAQSDQLDLLAPLATMALLVKMVCPAALAILAKTDSPALLDTQVIVVQCLYFNIFCVFRDNRSISNTNPSIFLHLNRRSWSAWQTW